MAPLMIDSISISGEGPSTMLTYIRPLASVCPDMMSQAGSLGKFAKAI